MDKQVLKVQRETNNVFLVKFQPIENRFYLEMRWVI